MRKRRLTQDRADPMGLFIDPITNFVGMMFFLVIFLLISIDRPEPPPRILAIQPLPCPQGLPYQFVVPVQGGRGLVRFRAPAGTLERLGLSLDVESGLISGVITAKSMPRITGSSTTANATKVLITVTDEAGRSHSAVLDFRIGKYAYPATEEDIGVRLIPQAPRLPSARSHSLYEGIVGAVGGLGKVAWSGSGLPLGIRIENGRLAGAPRVEGKYQVLVRAQFAPGSALVDGRPVRWNGGADEKKLALEVRPPLAAVTRPVVVRVGEDVLAPLFMSALLSEETLELTGLPPGLRHAGGGMLSGRAKDVGDAVVEYRVSTPFQEVAAGKIIVRVLPASPPKEVPQWEVFGRVGEELSTMVTYRGLVEPVTILPGASSIEGLVWSGLTLRGEPRRPGVSRLRLVVRDAVGEDVETEVKVNVLPSRTPLRIQLPGDVEILAGSAYSWPIAVAGGEAPGFVEPEGALPPGWQMKDGVLSGTFTTAGRWQVKLQAVDRATQERASGEFWLSAAWPEREELGIMTKSVPRAVVGREYVVHLAATGAVGSEIWALESGGPAWLKVADGALRGTPPREGTFGLRISARDSAGRSAGPVAFNLVVEEHERTKPVVKTATLPRAIQGLPYAVALASEGGLGLPVWELEGKLPQSFSFVEGVLQGTATAEEVGRYPLKFSVSDRRGVEGPLRALTLEVMRGSPELHVLTEALPVGIVGRKYIATLASTSVRSTWRVDGLPAGLTHAAGKIAGAPKEAGSWSLGVSTVDELGQTAGPVAVTLRVEKESCPVESHEVRARNLYSRGKSALLRDNLEIAESALLECSQINVPVIADCHRALGVLYDQKGDSSRSVRHYRLYLQLRPDASDAERVKGMMREAKSNPF